MFLRILNSILISFVVISLLQCSEIRVQGCDTERSFLCNVTDQCLPKYVRCDGDPDCPNGEDETGCDECGQGNRHDYFSCTSATNLCLHNSKKCDGHRDCPIHEDEDSCGESIQCKPNEFRCGDDRQCIPEGWRCDTQVDCEDGSDEEECGTESSNPCSPGEWRCKGSRQCIFAGWKCDNDIDCANGADEDTVMCSANVRDCPDDKFKCKKTAGNFECSPNRWLCDGTPDCEGGHDETNCTSRPLNTYQATDCGALEFQCANNECILLDWKCDGETDCADDSDENLSTCNSQTITVNCTADQYICAGENKCIPRELLCDGESQCLNGDDEKESECHPNGRPGACGPTQFRCRSGQCIPDDKACDSRNDCSDGSDEASCGPNPCEGQCTGDKQNCTVQYNTAQIPYGFQCECERGYAYHANDKVCVDVNECLERPRPCDQECLNTEGSYECRCEEGYLLGQNGTCRVSGSMHPKLLFSNRHDIRQVKVNAKDPEYTPLVFSKTAVAIDFDVQQRLVFYSDVTEKKIVKFVMPNEMDESDPELVELKFPHIKVPDGLAYDWVYKHLYWTDTESNTINMGCMRGDLKDSAPYSKVLYYNENTDCRSSQTLVTNSTLVCIDEPRAVAVHPQKGWIFWTDWGVNPHIARGALDGSKMEKLVYNTHSKTVVHWPNGITLDQSRGAERMYWIDAKLNSIYSCPLENCLMESALVAYSDTHIKHPYSITVFEDKLYWSDWVSHGIVTAHKRSGKNLKTLVEGLDQPMDLKVFHNVTQPASDNECSLIDESERCDHICVPKPWAKYSGYQYYQPPKSKRHTCLCSHGYKLNSDLRTCVEIPSLNAHSMVHHPVAVQQTSNIGIIAAAASGSIVVLGLVVGLTLFCVVRRRRAERAKAVARFENPVYKKTTAHQSEDRMELPANEYQPDRSVPAVMVPLTSPEATSTSNQNLDV